MTRRRRPAFDSALLPSKVGATGVNSFTPARYPNLLFWYDMGMGGSTSTWTFSGSNVTAVSDKSGNGYNLTAGTSIPTESSDGDTGNSVISFTNNSFLGSIGALSINYFHIFFVHTVPTAVSTVQDFITFGSSIPELYVVNGSGASPNIGAKYSTVSSNALLTSAIYTDGPDHCITHFAIDTVAKTITGGYINRLTGGNETQTGSPISFSTLAPITGNFILGASTSAGATGLSGVQMNSIFAFSSIKSQTEILDITNRIASFWPLYAE